MKKKIGFILLAIILSFGAYNFFKPMPIGTNYQSLSVPINENDIEFLFDLTYQNQNGEKISEQQIFSEVFSLIENSNQYILLDFFLFNSFTAKDSAPYRDLAQEMTEKIIAKKKTNPDIKIDFITDPINSVYGGSQNKQIEELKKNGVNVIITDITQLRDSNPIYSALWRTFFKWFGNSNQFQWVKHPFSDKEGRVSLRSYLAMFNFKANHRKVILADNQGELATIIASANPHSGSSSHSNVAWKIKGDLGKYIYETESGVAKFSKGKLQALPIFPQNSTEKNYTATLLTEKAIKKNLLEKINQTQGAENKILMAMFYLSDKDILSALKNASERNVKIKLILDPNKDAFGYQKNGVPNRPVASWLKKDSNDKIDIRWYDTHGEQFHSKLTFIKSKTESSIFLGSANLTRRNLENYNLEMNVMTTGEISSPLEQKVENYFNRIWQNENNQNYTANYEKYQDDSFFKKVLYELQESSGVSSF